VIPCGRRATNAEKASKDGRYVCPAILGETKQKSRWELWTESCSIENKAGVQHWKIVHRKKMSEGSREYKGREKGPKGKRNDLSGRPGS